MKPVSTLGIVVTTAACAVAVAAPPPQQCVNPDAVNGLVFLGRSDNKVDVTRSVPATMTGFRAPAGFSLIGTGLRSGGTTTVAYKTSLDSDKAYTALLGALGAEGWALETMAGPAATFRVVGGPRDGTVCRAGERRFLMVTETTGITYASIVMTTPATSRDCNTPEPVPRLGLGAFNAVPRFQFPAGTSLAQGTGGGGGNSDSYTMSSRVISMETPSRLVEHLTSQIAAQGWQPESQWSGGRAAGSAWRKAGENGPTWGTLEIIRVSDGTYDVDFTMAMPR